MSTLTNIKDYMNNDIFSVLNSFVSNIEQRIVANMYVGTVVAHDTFSNGDDGTPSPLLGKCRVMVYGVYDSIPTELIPWALPDEQWVGSLAGSFVVPPIGTLVRVSFDNNNIYRPTYTTKVLQAGKVSPLISKHYPNNMLMWTTDAGSSLQHDRSTGEEIKTNVVGSYTAETIKIATNNAGVTSVTTDVQAAFEEAGNIVETIYGAADGGTISDSFYNKTMNLIDSSTTEKFNIAMDGSLTFEHDINGNLIKVTLSADGVLTITTTLGNKTHVIKLDSSGIVFEDSFKNKITTDSSGIVLDSPNSKIDITCTQDVNITGMGINLDGTPGKIKIVKGTLATPKTGLPCALPACLLTGAPHTSLTM